MSSLFAGKYSLKVPTGSAFAETIANPGLPNVLATSERGKTSVAVFQTGTCSPYLQLGDRDSDGVFDILTYSALSEDGEILVNVEDYGMDGQPDLILNHTEATASVFYQGAWYPVDGVGGGHAKRQYRWSTATIERSSRRNRKGTVLIESRAADIGRMQEPWLSELNRWPLTLSSRSRNRKNE